MTSPHPVIQRVTVPGSASEKLLSLWERYEAQTTTYQAPVVWQRASGVTVWDVDGREYIDWTSGVLVTNVGHCHPKLVDAVQQAAGQLLNSYDFPTPSRIELARRMVEITPAHLDRCFFLTTGSEVVEAALRVAKRFTGGYETVSFFGGFHGRTYGSLSVGGLPGPKKSYGPIVPGAIHVPFPYLYRSELGPEECVEWCLDMADQQVRAASTGSLAAVLVEPYLGAAGFIFPPQGFLKRVEEWARERDMLLILDEVQSSFGRTGKMFALEWEDLHPQLLCLAKGMGSGIPSSCLMAESRVMSVINKGEMSSTCGGNPVSCAAALAVIEIIEEENLVANSLAIGGKMNSRLLEIQAKSSYLGDVRGSGLVIGLEIVKDKLSKEPAPDLTRLLIHRAAERGLLIGSVGIFGNVIRVAPPLVINEEEAHRSLDIFEDALLTL
jgi:4-aminobutyrate aminotransferase